MVTMSLPSTVPLYMVAGPHSPRRFFLEKLLVAEMSSSRVKARRDSGDLEIQITRTI